VVFIVKRLETRPVCSRVGAFPEEVLILMNSSSSAELQRSERMRVRLPRQCPQVRVRPSGVVAFSSGYGIGLASSIPRRCC